MAVTRRSIRTQAIVLGRTKLAEQDLILTLLASDGQQLRAVAKGARKPGGRLASRVELFCESDFLLAKGRSLDIVSEVQLLDAHPRLRGDYERVSAASAVCEVARMTCYEDVADPYLQPILSRALRACEEAEDEAQLDIVVAAYALKVLAHEGWRPELATCLACGDEDVSRFSARMGGMLCASCAKDVEDAIELTPLELSWLRALLGATFDALLASEVPSSCAHLLLTIVHGWCAEHLDTRLRAFEYLLSV